MVYFLKTTGEGRTPRRRARLKRHNRRFKTVSSLLFSLAILRNPWKSALLIRYKNYIVNIYFFKQALGIRRWALGQRLF